MPLEKRKTGFRGRRYGSYAANVEVMSRVYGYARINEMFAPLGKNKLGFVTVEAKEQLEKAQSLFNVLKQQEEQLADMSRPTTRKYWQGLSTNALKCWSW